MIRLTEEQCARCDNHLATSNRNKWRLCGDCQRELGTSRGIKSLTLREWIRSGKPRTIVRGEAASAPVALPTPAAPIDTKDLIAFIDRQSAAVARATEELQRRRAAAEELLRMLGLEPKTQGPQG